MDNSTAPQTLTLTYRSTSEESGETHYAVIPFPNSHEEALHAGLKLLSKYMPAQANAAEHVVLRCSAKNREGAWIWADFEPASWAVVVRPGDEVRLFEKSVLATTASQTEAAEALF
ncbi:hypothetical protein FB45DRAFT_43532 [Roridomyces roridus]|uniref:Uncharacterized protein n=1 Tax=Roridomyces roridus TaxID=1738132 RepID=A0AAD7BRG4_9AGAR|nr:hypothetical protein FB45DRAFT_43532 [Roridomyces roridus]